MKWEEMTLGDFISMKRGYDLPSGNRINGGVPIMGSAGLNGYHNEAKVKGIGVVIGRSGNSFGEIHICKEDFWAHNTTMYVNDFKGNDPIFAYYFLKNIDFKNYNSGSAQPSLNRNFLYPIKIKIPPLPTQQKIASILSAYDDLIENNLRRIRLLEEAAQLIYREWFVHLRFPGYAHTPVENGLPKGWARKKIGEVCESLGGGTPSTKEPRYWEGGDIIWFSPTDLSKNSSLVLLDSEKKITEEGLQNSSAKLLPPRTILMSSRATIGLFGIISQPCATNQGFISIVPNEEYCRYYLLFNLMDRKQEIINNANGSTFKEISKKNFREMDIVMPSVKLLKQFYKVAETFINQIENFELQNQNLKAARDILLPRLMNQTIGV